MFYFFTLSLLFSTATFAANHIVTMKSLSFDPKVLEIKKGDTVEWANKAHTEHAASFKGHNDFNTGMIRPGQSSAKIHFTTNGTYPYECLVHGSAMSGKVIVK